MGHFATMFDTLQNLVTGLGKAGVDSSTAVQYILNLIDRPSLENMYRGDWLARKIVDAPAEDMTREWRAWQASQEQIEALEEIEKKFELQRKVKLWISRARLYGGSALVLGVDDGLDPSQPIDLDKCKKDCLKYVVVLNCFDLNPGPRIYNVLDEYFSRPAYYTISMPMFEGGTNTLPAVIRPEKKSFAGNVVSLFGGGWKQEMETMPMGSNIGGMAQIHPSRVIELAGNELPDWRLAPMGGGWGDSVLQTVVDDMQSFTTTIRSVSAMVSDGKLDVVKIPDMALNMTTKGYKDKLIERFALSTQTKSVISALLLDKEEEWDRVNTQYGGLPMIMHEFITLISGAADIPVSRLFGQARGQGLEGGSTAGGADDLRNYYDNCSSKQKNDIAPRLATLDQVLLRSVIGREDPNVYYDWNPLWQMSDAEKAEIAYKKSQTTQVYSTIGIINSDALREGVVNQLIEDGTYPGLDDAIEEFGAEPELDDETGGFIQPNGMPAQNMAATAAQETEISKMALEAKAKAAKPKTAAKDYDPDQERDDHGRWTAGGGGSEQSSEPQQQGGGEPANYPNLSGVRVTQLESQWAYLGKQLFQYTDEPPNDPVVRKLVAEQVQIRHSIHSFHAVKAASEGQTSGGVRDVVIVGAGPAGMSAGIYGGSEGLKTLVVEANPEVGGQAGSSSRIENVIGFPTGLSGEKLARDSEQQVKRLGGEVQLNKRVTGLEHDEKTGVKTLKFSDGSTVQSHAVVIAGGVQFNQVKIPGADSPDVVYGSSGKLKARVGDGNAIIVGGANSAGQAAMDTAITSRHVTLMARGGLDNMSDYLKSQIEKHPRISVLKNEITEIIKDQSTGRMIGAKLKDGAVLDAKGVLYAIGSKPKTDWAGGIERDEKGFIKVGGEGRANLETSIPGVFAAGDVRSGAIGRVITAAGDGAAAISMIHGYLEKVKNKKVGDALQDEPVGAYTGLHVRIDDEASAWLDRVHAYDKKNPYMGFGEDD